MATNSAVLTEVAPGVWRMTVGVPEAFVPSRFHQIAPKLDALQSMPQVQTPIVAGTLTCRQAERGLVLEMRAGDGEDFYGLGLQLRSHCQTGLKKTLRVNSDPVADTGDSHAPVPLLVSSAGWAVAIDTARYATFCVASHSRADGLLARQRQIEYGSTDALYTAEGSTNALSIEIPIASGVDIYFFAGPAMLDAVRRYNLFSGGGAMPPMWGLGVWYRADARSDAKAVSAIAHSLREQRIPCDVIGLEPGWQSHAYPCTFVWSPDRFPDPPALVRDLEGEGFRVNLWEHAFTHPESPLAMDFRDKSCEYTVFNGLVPDFTLEPVRRRFSDYHGQQFIDQGISGFKLDECDGSDFIKSPWSFPEHSQFPSGIDGECYHSLFGKLYQEAVLAPYRQAGRRTWGLVRNSHLWASPLPFVLYSDLYAHADFLRGLINAGFGGLLWTPEVRDSKSAKDLMRRLASTILSPLALINAWYIPNPPWIQFDTALNVRGERHPDADELTAAARRLLECRMQLLPYLYTAFADYHFSGTPPFRAMVMDFPDDPQARRCEGQLMVGDQLLAAFATEAEDEVNVYLPPGRWRGVWDGSSWDGGGVVRLPVPLDLPVLLIRDDSILLLADPVQSVGPGTKFHIQPRIFGHPQHPIRLFEDDGETFNFENGQHNWVYYHPDGTINRQGDYREQRYTFAPGETA